MAKRNRFSADPEPEIEEAPIAGEVAGYPAPPPGFARLDEACALLTECLTKFARSNARLPSRADWPPDTEELLGRIKAYLG